MFIRTVSLGSLKFVTVYQLSAVASVCVQKILAAAYLQIIVSERVRHPLRFREVDVDSGHRTYDAQGKARRGEARQGKARHDRLYVTGVRGIESARKPP